MKHFKKGLMTTLGVLAGLVVGALVDGVLKGMAKKEDKDDSQAEKTESRKYVTVEKEAEVTAEN